MEGAAANALSGQYGEKVLDRIEPRAGSWGEVEGPARMPFQPRLDLRVLMGRVVIDDGLDQLACWDIALDGVEEADELLVPVPLHAPSDHPPVQHVQRREQRGRAMPLIVVRHGGTATGLERQARLGAIERLDLALFVDRQHHGMCGRVDVKADDVDQLFGKLWVARPLEAAHLVRFEVMRLPN